MSQNYVIGPAGPAGTPNGAALYLPNRKHPACIIVNTGPVVVYASDTDPVGDPSQGLPLKPGSSVPWDADLPLYMVCPTKGMVTIVGTSGVPFDAGAIATEIIDQGLAQSIANAVEASGLSGDIATDILTSGLGSNIAGNIVASGLASAIAQNIAISGAPPIDRYTQLHRVTGTGTGYSTGQIDTSSYASINIHVSNGFPSRLSSGKFNVSWYSSGAQPGFPTVALIAQDEFYIGTGVYTDVTLPVRGAVAVISVSGNSGSCGFDLYGSYKASKPFYLGQGAGTFSGSLAGSGFHGMQTWYGPLGAGETWTWQPDTTAGVGRLNIRFNQTGNISYIWRAAGSIFPLSAYLAQASRMIASGDTLNFTFTLPPVPVELELTNNAMTAQNFRATYIPEQPYQ